MQARGYYRIPLHRQPAMAPYARASTELPVTDALAPANVALPMSPVLAPEQAGDGRGGGRRRARRRLSVAAP